MDEMIHFSLFSGIGGFDLAAEWMGWDNYLSCEIEDFPNQVLNHYWPDAYHHRDIKNLDYDTIQNELTRRFGEWRTKPVILTGGFPCQPYSQAGQRKGKEDERHLWPEMLRLIHEIKPDFIVGENVFGLLNWNGGMVFDEVLTDLGSAGYDVTPLVIPAAAVNAPHGRDRVWFVAQNTMLSRCVHRESKQERTEVREQWNTSSGSSERIHLQKGDATDTNSNGQFKRWRYDGSSKDDERCNSSKQWSANTKNVNGCSSDRILKNKSKNGRGIGKQADVQKDKTTRANKICRVDKADNTKEIIGNNEFTIDKSRTLVSERFKGIFAPTYRGLEHCKIPFKKLAAMGLSIDIPRINTVEGDVTDTKFKGLEGLNRQREGCTEHRGDQRVFIGAENKLNATDTDGNGLQRGLSSDFNKQQRSEKINVKKCVSTHRDRIPFEKFPTQSPICGGDDGLPT